MDLDNNIDNTPLPEEEKKYESNVAAILNEEEPHSSRVGKVGLFFLEAIKVLVLAGITICFVRYFLFKPFIVKGESMVPNFHPNDYLIIDELSYRFREPIRGEPVVFRAPLHLQKDYYLKRLIALPGERVHVENNRVIVYNDVHPKGMVVKEEYLVEDTPGAVSYTLGPNQYFVLGDNRDASFDSRRFGPIGREAIVGRTWVRGWPLNRLDVFEVPEYNL